MILETNLLHFPYMKNIPGLIVSMVANGLITEHTGEFGTTQLYGAMHAYEIELPLSFTHFGIVSEGEVVVTIDGRKRTFFGGDYFSCKGRVKVESAGICFIVSTNSYKGVNVFGGPVENLGRLKYIDGCSDSLLIPPVIKGNPCLNHLHFPKNITQTPHTNPSIRVGLVYKGNGECLLDNGEVVLLSKGSVFLLAEEVIHSFNTSSETMDIIVFHPDSDFGPEDNEHPMINRTIVDGISAKNKEAIRTTTIN